MADDYLGKIMVKLGSDSTDLVAGLAEGRRAYDRLGLEMKKLQRDMDRGVIGLTAYKQRTDELTRAQRELAAAMRDGYTRAGSALDGLGKSFEGGGSKAQAFSRGVLEASRGIEDLTTGGALGLLNNIPTTFQAMATAAGKSATFVGIATGAVSGLATASYLAYQHYDKLTALFEEERTKGEAEHMEALEKATTRTAEETRNLTRAKREQADLEATLQRRTKAQELTRDAVDAAIAEVGDDEATGGMKVKIGLEQALAKQGMGEFLLPLEAQKLKDSEARLASLKGQIDQGMPGTADPDVAMQAAIAEEKRIQQRILDLRKRIRDAVAAQADKMIEQAKVNPIPLAEMAEKRPDLFPEKLAKGLREATPAAREAVAEEEQRQAQIDTEFDESMTLMKQGIARRKQKRQEAERETDREISTLVSGKAKKLEDAIGDDILKRIQLGEDRAKIEVEMGPDVERRLGDVPHAREASKKLLRQATEKTFTDVMVAKEPGMTDAQAAAQVLAERQKEAAEKADRQDPHVGKFEGRRIKDPVTGKFLTRSEMDSLVESSKDIAKAGDRAARAATPQGQMREFNAARQTRTMDLANQVGFHNPGLGGDQVMAVANTANQLMARGMNRQAAISEAMLRLNQQMMQTMMLQEARANGFMGTIGQLNARLRRMQGPMRSKRPSLGNAFPGGW